MLIKGHVEVHADEYLSCEELTFDDTGELYVFLDSSNEDRGVRGVRDRAPGTVVLNLDHHEDNSRYGTLACVDPSCASTTELLYRLFRAEGWTVTTAIAESLYTGLVTDTGAFMFSNTTPRAHRMAADLLELGVDPSRIEARIYHNRSLEAMALWARALSRIEVWGRDGEFSLAWLSHGDFAGTGSQAADTEGLVNQLLTIRGIRFAMLLSELEPGRVKISFRSEEGTVPAAAVARSLGGGGDRRLGRELLILVGRLRLHLRLRGRLARSQQVRGLLPQGAQRGRVVGDLGLESAGGAPVARGRGLLGEFHLGPLDVVVGDGLQQVVDHIDARLALVLRLHDVPARRVDVGVHEHLVLGARVVLPPGDGLQVRGRELPAPHGVGLP